MRSMLQLQADLASIGGELTAANESVRALAMNGAASMEDITAAKAKRDGIQERFNIIKQAHDEAQSDAQAQLSAQRAAEPRTEAAAVIRAKAAFYRAAIANPGNVEAAIRSLPADVLNTLEAIPAGGGSGGENFLPTTLVNDLISEPFATNPLRTVIRMSATKGLELPRIAYTLDGDDDDSIGDGDTAAELEATGDKVQFGRLKAKVICRIADSVYYGSDVDLVNHVENALRSGLAAREKKLALTASPKVGQEHCSFYQVNGEGASIIKEVSGATLFKAIKAAIADLPEDFRENAKVCMAYADYVEMLEEIANGNAAFWTAPPEQILGKPAIFADAATTPIVGDFGYCQLNYDGEPVYDTDKDVEAGEFLFVLTSWLDVQRRLNTAFRLAVVEESV